MYGWRMRRRGYEAENPFVSNSNPIAWVGATIVALMPGALYYVALSVWYVNVTPETESMLRVVIGVGLTVSNIAVLAVLRWLCRTYGLFRWRDWRTLIALVVVILWYANAVMVWYGTAYPEYPLI